jgi:hypothetical protein
MEKRLCWHQWESALCNQNLLLSRLFCFSGSRIILQQLLSENILFIHIAELPGFGILAKVSMILISCESRLKNMHRSFQGQKFSSQLLLLYYAAFFLECAASAEGSAQTATTFSYDRRFNFAQFLSI